MPPRFSNLPPALVNYSVIRTTSHSWKFVAERGFRLGIGMRWGTWIHSEGPKGRHDRLGIPSQDPRNNLENKTKGHCTNLMIAQVCYVETSHQKNMTLEEKKNLQKMGLGKKKVFSSYSWPLHTAHGLKERWHTPSATSAAAASHGTRPLIQVVPQGCQCMLCSAWNVKYIGIRNIVQNEK